MRIEPQFAAFSDTYSSGIAQVVWTRLVADLETPVSAMLKLADERRFSFLLESVQGGEVRGRYSIIGLNPDLMFRVRNGQAEINRQARIDFEAFEAVEEKPLDSLRQLIKDCKIDLPTGIPPMAAGLFGFMTYDIVGEMEKLPPPKDDPIGLPDAIFIRPTVTAVFDSVTGEVIQTAPVWPDTDVNALTAYDRAVERLTSLVVDLDRSLPRTVEGPEQTDTPVEYTSNTTYQDYIERVERAKQYIKAGDIFQVVPSQRFSLPFTLPPFSLYRALRQLNPSPFLYYLSFDGYAVIGSSPEILVRVRNNEVTVRPIAGTAPRGATPEEDRRLGERLLQDPKERAEHLMLLDLGRNDVGRVSKTGTVTVTEEFSLEHYSHVMHIVSNVTGELSDDQDALSALIAGFPAGTVSGAPKIRAMEIINELETEKRGIYAGMIGYFAADGSMDSCIALRTAVIKNGVMYVQAGGGVVADSDPHAEYEETINKAKALMRAAQEAAKFTRKTSPVTRRI